MKCDERMRHLGPVDIASFVAALAAQPDSLWDADLDFQKRLAPYRKTRTIYLLMTVGGPLAPTRELAGWVALKEAFAPVAARIAGFYPRPGRVLNAQVALLGPGLEIPEHVDFGPTLEVTHRVHVPLETHPAVQFIVEDESIPLQVGQAYELDNMRRHRVHNPSPFRRVHIIVDYYEEPLPLTVAASH